MSPIPYYEQELIFNLFNSIFISIFVVSFLVAFLFYIFQAIGLYRMSKNRGYQYPWLAFIPIAGSYVLGGVADNINACYGRRSIWRIWTVILSGISIVSSIVSMIYSLSWISDLLNAVFSGFYNEYYFLDSFSSFGPMFLFIMLGSLVSLANTVISMVCFYKIYQDYSRNAILFLILSILFGIAPFFLFAIRNNPSASLLYRGQTVRGWYQNPNPPYPPQPPYPLQYPNYPQS